MTVTIKRMMALWIFSFILGAMIYIIGVFLFMPSAEAETVYGKAPKEMTGSRAKYIARRAAVAEMYRKTDGKTPKILSEDWDGQYYWITF